MVLCGRLANSNFLYTEEAIPCTNFCVHVTPFDAICEGLILCDNNHRMHPPSPWQKQGGVGGGGGGGVKKNMALGARFQKLKGDLTIRRGLDFQQCYFCGNIVINYLYHYVYS